MHVFSWPAGSLVCPGLAGRVRYASFLHDGAEVQFTEVDADGFIDLTRRYVLDDPRDAGLPGLRQQLPQYRLAWRIGRYLLEPAGENLVDDLRHGVRK